MLETKRGFNLRLEEKPKTEVVEIYDWYLENLKLVPNIARVMSEAPALLKSYWQTQQNLLEMSTLSPEENNIVQMTIAVKNRCVYCATGHLFAGEIIFGSSQEVMENIIEESELPEEKLNALRTFALQIYQNKGEVSDKDLDSFYRVGYTRGQALDVVTNISTKIMSNFTNKLSKNELDEVLEPLAKKFNY